MTSPSYFLVIQHEPFHICHSLSHIISFSGKWKLIPLWLFSSDSSLLVLDFSDVLIVTCGSSGISFGASSIITQAFSLATSAANWILWVSNSSGHVLFMYSSSAINSAIFILSTNAPFSPDDQLLNLPLDLFAAWLCYLLLDEHFVVIDGLELRCLCLSISASFIQLCMNIKYHLEDHSVHPPCLSEGGGVNLQPNFQKGGAWQNHNF